MHILPHLISPKQSSKGQQGAKAFLVPLVHPAVSSQRHLAEDSGLCSLCLETGEGRRKEEEGSQPSG